MSDIRSSDWSIVADDNNQSPPNGWPENQLPSSVNNSAREMMAAIKRSWNDDHPVNITSGSSSAYTVVTSASSTAYATGDAYVLRVNHESTGTSTLNVNGIGAKIVKKFGNVDTGAGDIKANQIIQVGYDPANDWFQLLSPVGGGSIADLTATSSAATSDLIRADISGVEQKISVANFASSVMDTFGTAATGDTLVYDGSVWAPGSSGQIVETTVSTGTITAGDTIVEWKNLPSGFVEIEFLGSYVIPNANMVYGLELSNDNGASYTSSGYVSSNMLAVANALSANTGASRSNLLLGGTHDAGSVFYFSGRASKTTSGSSARAKFSVRYQRSSDNEEVISEVQARGGFGDFNAIRLVGSANATHSGVIRVIYHTV